MWIQSQKKKIHVPFFVPVASSKNKGASMDVEQSRALHAGETALLERGAVRPYHAVIEVVHVPGYPRSGGIRSQFLYRLPEL